MSAKPWSLAFGVGLGLLAGCAAIKYFTARQVENELGDIARGSKLLSFVASDPLRWDAMTPYIAAVGAALALLGLVLLVIPHLGERKGP